MALVSFAGNAVAAVVALGAIAGANALRLNAIDDRASWPKVLDTPFAPSPESTPFVSLGYRELLADLLWIRLVGYSSGDEDIAAGTADLALAIEASDPYFEPLYQSGAERITTANYGDSVDTNLIAAGLLTRGADRFPDRWRYPFNAGQTYVLDLAPAVEDTDAAQAKAWRELGITWLQRSIGMPGTPGMAGVLAANMLTKLGRAQQAESNLLAAIMRTEEPGPRSRLLKKLASMREQSIQEVEAELDAARHTFATAWQRDRFGLPAPMYVMLGPAPTARFDLEQLATTRDLLGADLEPPALPLPPLADDVGELPLTPTVP